MFRWNTFHSRIMADLHELEMEITAGLAELEEML